MLLTIERRVVCAGKRKQKETENSENAASMTTELRLVSASPNPQISRNPTEKHVLPSDAFQIIMNLDLEKRERKLPMEESLPTEPTSLSLQLTHHTQQLLFQDKLPFLILLTRLVCLVVLPSHRLLALSACDIPNDMSPGSHATLHGFGLRDIDHGVE